MLILTRGRYDDQEPSVLRRNPWGELVEYYAVEGTWWLPQSPDHRVPGKLTFDADGLTLLAYGSLVRTVPEPGAVLVEGPPDWETVPLILGRLHDGQKVTLLEAGGANFIGPRATRSEYRVWMALAGIHAMIDEFVEVWCKFDCLTILAEPPALATDLRDAKQFDLRFEHVTLGHANVGDDSAIRLIGQVMGEVGGSKVNVTQEAAFVINQADHRARHPQRLDTATARLANICARSAGTTDRP